jgi:K+-transporting ATPase KdpF subunit
MWWLRYSFSPLPLRTRAAATSSEEKPMVDYILTGVVSLLLLVYLIYALLKPERF